MCDGTHPTPLRTLGHEPAGPFHLLGIAGLAHMPLGQVVNALPQFTSADGDHSSAVVTGRAPDGRRAGDAARRFGLPRTSPLDEKPSRPTVPLVMTLQEESRASVIRIARPGRPQRRALGTVPRPAPAPVDASDPAGAPVPPSGGAPGGDSPEHGLPRRQDEPPAGEASSHDGAPSLSSGPTGAGGGHPEPTQPEDLPPVPEISTTPSGLPVRVPQANLAEPLRTDEPQVADERDEPDDPGRSPEEIKRMMGSYQRGTRQGRSAAAEALGNQAAEGEEGQ
ncbi:hypothetical protein GCM10009527_018970 [Actinomadura nitritigenes]